jgi:HlyD family secretion protein
MRIERTYRAGILAVVVGIVAVGSIRCPKPSGADSVRASGTIEGTQVDVAAQVGGRVQVLRVHEGDLVRTGETLAILDHSGPDLQLEQAQAGMELADAQLRLLLKGAREEDISQAEEAVRQAQASLKVAQDDARRAGQLFAAGSATQKQKEDGDARLTAATAQYNAARQALGKLEHLARPEDVQSGRARLKQATSVRDLAQKAVDDCHVTAPIRGTVTNKVLEAGDLAGPGSVVVTVTRLDTVTLTIYVSEMELGRVKLGAPADVSIDASRKRLLPGKVVYVSPRAEFTPKNVQTREDRVKLVFAVKVEIPNPDGTLKPGLPADAVVRGLPPRND